MKDVVDCAGHDAPIHLCGVCGILDIMPHSEKHILILRNEKIKFLIAKPNELNKLTKARRETMKTIYGCNSRADKRKAPEKKRMSAKIDL